MLVLDTDESNDSNYRNDNSVSAVTTSKSEEFSADIAAESYNGGATYYVSCYPYESGEIGDLTFGAGEYITVIKKDGDWWTGQIGTRTGIFPSNYVQEVGAAGDAYSTDLSANQTDNTPPYEPAAVQQSISSTSASQNYSDDVRNQEEADTEVSEINTQSKSSENVQDTYSRPMSTSSTTSVNHRSLTPNHNSVKLKNKSPSICYGRGFVAAKRVKLHK